MSDPNKDSLNELLAGFELGPAWAKANAAPHSAPAKGREPREARHDTRHDETRGKRSFDRDGDGRKPFRGRGPGRKDDRREAPPRTPLAEPAEGVRVTLVPDAQAVHLIGKEVHQVARVYPLFDVARILLAERGRCRAVFEIAEPHPPLLRGTRDESLFLTREEAARHLWHSPLRAEFLEEETLEVDPPSGNFQLVARCGLSGEWLGPPNFHTYQANLRRIHRERFAHLPFGAYTAKVRTERGEEAVNAWLDTMKRKTRWRLKDGDPDAWIDDVSIAERALAGKCLDAAFESTRRAEVLASIPPENISSALMISLKMAGNHARNHPAILIPAVCKALEAEHLPVFKRQGKLFTGPARPHPLPADAILAERPGIMVNWIRSNPPAKLEGLWKAVLPEGATAPPAEFAADLFWLLHQGHILLFTDDTLVVQEIRPHSLPGETETPKTGKKKKRKSGKTAVSDANKPAPASEATDVDTTEEASDEPAVLEAPVIEPPIVEPPQVEAPVVAGPVVETDFAEGFSETTDISEPGVDEPSTL